MLFIPFYIGFCHLPFFSWYKCFSHMLFFPFI